jgi:hypothetical protein
MASVASTDGRCIIGPPHLACVEPDGTLTPRTQLWTGPSEEVEPAALSWPAWTDNWFWETDAADVVALEAAEAERLADLADAPDAAWSRMMAESLASPPVAGGGPEPTAEDLRDLEAWLSQVDRPDPPHDQVEDPMGFPRDWTPAEKARAIADIAASFRAQP